MDPVDLTGECRPREAEFLETLTGAPDSYLDRALRTGNRELVLAVPGAFVADRDPHRGAEDLALSLPLDGEVVSSPITAVRAVANPVTLLVDGAKVSVVGSPGDRNPVIVEPAAAERNEGPRTGVDLDLACGARRHRGSLESRLVLAIRGGERAGRSYRARQGGYRQDRGELPPAAGHEWLPSASRAGTS